MTSYLSKISRSVSKPARIIIYGVPGIGKSTLAANAPDNVFIPVEDGLTGIEVDAFPQAKSFADVRGAIGALIEEDHEYKSVTIDSVDVLEPLIWEEVCQEGGKTSIGDFAYGKGYESANDKWRELTRGLDILRDKGMTIILLAHSQVVRFESPDSDGYDRWTMRLHKKGNATLQDWADGVFFLNHETRVVSASGGDRKIGKSTGKRVIHTVENAAWMAKNRYRMPESIELLMENPWSEIAKYLPQN